MNDLLRVRGASPKAKTKDSMMPDQGYRRLTNDFISIVVPKKQDRSVILIPPSRNTKLKNSSDDDAALKQRWRIPQTSFEMDPLRQVYRRNAEDYAIKARAMANNALRRPHHKIKIKEERPETSRSRSRRLQKQFAESMGALSEYTISGYREIHRTLDEIEFALNNQNPIVIKDNTMLDVSQKVVSLPSLPTTLERRKFDPILRYSPPRVGQVAHIMLAAPIESPAYSDESFITTLKKMHDSSAFQKDFETLLALESRSEGTFNAILSNHFQILTDNPRLSNEQGIQMVSNFIAHVKSLEEPLITKPICHKLEPILGQITTLTCGEAVLKIRPIILSQIPHRKRIMLKGWISHLCRLSQSLGRDILSGLSALLSDLLLQSVDATSSGDEEWDQVLKFMNRENTVMNNYSSKEAIREKVLEMQGPLSIQESVIEFLLRYSRALL